MSSEYTIDPKEGLVRIQCVGKISMAAAIEIFERVAADAHYQPHFRVLFDVRLARYTADLNDGDELVAVLRKKDRAYQNKVAVVVPESLHIIAKLYCLLSNTAGFDRIMTFTDLDQAKAWLSGSSDSSTMKSTP